MKNFYTDQALDDILPKYFLKFDENVVVAVLTAVFHFLNQNEFQWKYAIWKEKFIGNS